MEEYCKKAAPFWRRNSRSGPAEMGEKKFQGLEPYEMLAAFFTAWGYLNQQGMESCLYLKNAFQLLDLGGTGLITDSKYLPYISTTEIEKDKTEGYHIKLHGIFANGGDGEMQYTLRMRKEI